MTRDSRSFAAARVPGHREQRRLRLALDADAPLAELLGLLRRHRVGRGLRLDAGQVLVGEPEDLHRR